MKKIFGSHSTIVDKCLKNSSNPTPVSTLDDFFEEYNKPDKRQTYTATIIGKFNKKMSPNEVAHFYVLTRHILFKDDTNSLMDEIVKHDCSFDSTMKSIKATS